MNLGMNHVRHFLNLIIWPGLPTEYDSLRIGLQAKRPVSVSLRVRFMACNLPSYFDFPCEQPSSQFQMCGSPSSQTSWPVSLFEVVFMARIASQVYFHGLNHLRVSFHSICRLEEFSYRVSPFGGAFRLKVCFHWVCDDVCCLQASQRSPVIEQRKKLLFIPADFCLLYTSPSPRDQRGSRMPSSA